MFLWIKGVVLGFCEAQHLRDVSLQPASSPAFEDGWCVQLAWAGKPLGLLGLVQRRVREEWRIAGPVGAAELRLQEILVRPPVVPAVSPLPAYPSVARDLALVVAETVKHEDVLRVAWSQAPKELTQVVLFDIFRSPSLGEGKKSLAYTFVYRSMERTLTDEDVNRYNAHMIEALRQGLDAEIRES
jgi:phenylalanyl-tRNA synthetase beta chain